MSRKNIKTIIKEELNNILGNSLYVFDFDDTLVTDTATVYVKTPSGESIPLTNHEFHNYKVKEGETLDFREFDDVTAPSVHKSIMSLLKRHLDNSVILTARTKTGPIKKYMNGLGVHVPQIIAVGSRDEDQNSVIINAMRKRDWIDKAIQVRDLKYVEFWDDNEHNVENVESLQKKYPDVKIICHLVNHGNS